MSYAEAPVFHQAANHVWILVLLMAPGWTCGFVQIIAAVRNGIRDRIAGLPLAMTCAMLIHDLTYAVNYDHYFNSVDHLFWKLCWVGMVPSVLIEIFLISQWWRYNRPQIAPELPANVVNALLALGLLGGFATFWYVQSVAHDRLDLLGLTFVQAGATVFLVPWIISRGSTRGQSRAFAWATAFGPASLGQVFIPYLSPAFRTWQLYSFLAVTTLLGFAYALLYEHYRRLEAKRTMDAALAEELSVAA